MKRLARLLPERIGVQIAALLVVALLLAQAVTAVTFVVLRPPRGGADDSMARASQIAFAARLLDAQPDAAARAQLAEALAARLPGLALAPPETIPREPPPRPSWLVGALRHELDERFRIGQAPTASGERIEIGLPSGPTLSVPAPSGLRDPRPPLGPVLSALLFVAAAIVLLSLWATRGLVAPLSAFAAAVETYDAETPQPPLPETGPAEVTQVTRAFNRMRGRIDAMMADRTRMIAAVGHDLRTPITRLRLRAEDIPDVALRGQMLADLGAMERMVQSALSFLRDGRARLRREPVDLDSLLQAICDDHADVGVPVGYSGCGRRVLDCDAGQLTRAVSNLIDNAAKFAGRVEVTLRPLADGGAAIAVCDDGPGIPGDTAKAEALKPFHRGDPARSSEQHEGFGLGLAIAAEIVAAHGGRLRLEDAEPRGLAVRIDLPAAPR